jgi:hypothetical protein
LPVDFLKTKEPGTWKVVDWADDNKTLLAIYSTASTTESVLINREDATKSLHASSIYPNISFTDIQLRSRKNDLVYLFDKNSGVVYRADLTQKTFETVLSGVLAYMPYGDDAYLYITKGDAKEGYVQAVLRVGEKNYRLRDVQQDESYLLAISKLGNAYVVGVGAPKENRIVVYNDPIHSLETNDFSTIPVPTTVLSVNTPIEVLISTDSSVIMVRSDSAAASHEFEADRSYAFNLSVPVHVATEARWVDGQHIVYTTESGALQMVDFDGSNSYELVKQAGNLQGYFDRNMDFLFSVGSPAEGTSTPPLLRHYMRTKADR